LGVSLRGVVVVPMGCVPRRILTGGHLPVLVLVAVLLARL